MSQPLRTALAQINSGSIAPVFGNSPNDCRESHGRVDEHAGYDFYAGHYGYEVYTKLANDHLLITNFRDPVQRVFSLYRYWRYNCPIEVLGDLHPRDLAVVLLAHKLSFSEFIRADNEDLQLYIRNFHFRQLYGCGWHWSTTRWHAEWIVKRRIRHMPWLYIAEMPEVSTFLLQDICPQATNITVPRINRSQGAADGISNEDAEHLIRYNLLDYSSYSYAVKIQTARLKEAIAK